VSEVTSLTLVASAFAYIAIGCCRECFHAGGDTVLARNRIFRAAAKHHKSEKMTELMQSVRIRQAVLVKSPQHRLPSAIRCAEGASELVGQEVSGPASAR
jgi:hypothetical protein